MTTTETDPITLPRLKRWKDGSPNSDDDHDRHMGEQADATALIGPPVTLGELEEAYPEEDPEVVRNLFRRGEVVGLNAAPKVGKSFFAGYLTCCVIDERTVFDTFRCVDGGDVLLIDMELKPGTIVKRLRAIAYAMKVKPEILLSRIHVRSLRGERKNLFNIVAWAEQFVGKYKLVILDSFFRTIPKGYDENSNPDLAELFGMIEAAAERMGSAWLVIHHQSRGNQSSRSVTDTGSGAGAQSRLVDAHLTLRQHEEAGAYVLEGVLRTFKEFDPICLRKKYPIFERADDLDPTRLFRAPSPNGRGGSKPAEEKPTALTKTLGIIRETIKKAGVKGMTKTGLKTATGRSGTTIRKPST